jgi:tetratricopeptide (TPR) repeat protein
LTEPAPFRYRAFLSYSHRDTKWAKWLHAALENYRIDKDLFGRKTPAGPVPPTLQPIFRDREDFSAGHSLTEQTEAALEASQFMIVLCSPNAAKSQYVNEEIRRFKALGRGDFVIPLIVDGEPGDPERECFPQALRFKVGTDGALTHEQEEPIAADARPQGDGKDIAKIKLVAGLLGLGFDEIVRRAERARKRRTRMLAAVVASFLFLAVTASASVVYGYNKLVQSDETLDFAVEVAYGLVSDANTQADRLGVTADTRLTWLRRAEATLDRVVRAGRNTPLLRYRRALMLLSFSDNYYKLGQSTDALQRADEARAQLGDLVAQLPERLPWRRDLAQAHVRIGDVRLDQGALATALTNYRAALDIMQKLVDADPTREEWQVDLARAHEKVGNTVSDRGVLTEAIDHYRRSLDIGTGLSKANPANNDAKQVTSIAHQRLAGALMTRGSFEDALKNYSAGLGLREALAQADSKNSRWQRELITLHNEIGNTFLSQGSYPEALTSYRKGETIAARLVEADPKNAIWQRELSISRMGIGDVQKGEGEFEQALATYQSGSAIGERLAKADPKNAMFQRDLTLWYDRTGEVQNKLGQQPDAYANYLKSIEISRRLAESDPTNTIWQRDLALADQRVGDLLLAHQKFTEAQKTFEVGFDICKALIAADASNSQWQRDTANFIRRIASVKEAQKDFAAALKDYTEARTILEPLSVADPVNLPLQRELWGTQGSIAEMQLAQGAKADGIASYRVSLAIAERVAAANPDSAQWQLNVAVTQLNLAVKGDDTLNRLRAVGEIVKKLRADYTLTAAQEKLVTQLEALLVAFAPK